MKLNKLPFLLSISIILSLVVVSLFISVFIVRNRKDITQNEQSDYLNLSFGKTFSQPFIARNDYLNIILINMKNPGLVNKDQYLVSLYSETGKMLAQQTISGFNIGDPGPFRFQFAPISNSKNRPFELKINALSESSEVVLGLAIKQGNTSVFENLKINGAKYEGTLTFSTYYRNINKAETIKDFLSKLLGNFRNDPIFSVIWLTAVIGLLMIILRGIYKTPF